MTRTSTVTLVIAIFVSSMIFLSLAVSHAAEKAPDDDAFLLGCIWTGDHKRTVCGEFTGWLSGMAWASNWLRVRSICAEVNFIAPPSR
jgi:hypothetical protein